MPDGNLRRFIVLNKAFRGEVWNNIDKQVLDAIVGINDEAVDGKVG